MKTSAFFVISVGLTIFLFSCHNDENRYVDVNTGTAVTLKKDTATGLMVNAETGKPVKIYVDTRTHDTIYGKNGKVINGHVVKSTDGVYVYDDDAEVRENAVIKNEGDDYKVKGEDYKKKVDDDEVKIKTDDKKIKIDKETGERKEKKRFFKKVL